MPLREILVRHFYLLTACLMAMTTSVHADTWSSGARIAFDTSVRVAHNTTTDNTDGFIFSGVDAHRVFSNEKGDFGTLLFQVYAAKLQDVEGHPPIFADENDTEITYRNVYFNYTGLGRGLVNFKVGHFEVPFGIEHYVTTNGELRDYQHRANIGVKADWGASINGGTQAFDYEVAWQRGSGNEWETEGDPGLIAARVGTSRRAPWSVGLSYFEGDIFRYADPQNPLERDRVGIDFSYAWHRMEFLGEFSRGKDFDDDVTSSLAEVNMYSKDTTWFFYGQLRHSEIDSASTDHITSATIGWKFEPDNHWSVSADYIHELNARARLDRQRIVRAQLRYRFQ